MLSLKIQTIREFFMMNPPTTMAILMMSTTTRLQNTPIISLPAGDDVVRLVIEQEVE